MEIMEFENFCFKLSDRLKKELSALGMHDLIFERNDTVNVNHRYTGFCIRPVESDAALNIDVDYLYGAFLRGISFDEIVKKTVKMAIEQLISMPDFAVFKNIRNYAWVRERLFIRIFSIEKNAELLKIIPYREMEDLAIGFAIMVETPNHENVTVTITNSMLAEWGITDEELYADALESAPKVKPVCVERLSDLVCRMLPSDELYPDDNGIDCPLLVVRPTDYILGAGVIAYPGFLERAAQMMGGDYLIIPSSVHEVILCPDNGLFDKEFLGDLVRDVNLTNLLPEERLSDNVYHYSVETKKFKKW